MVETVLASLPPVLLAALVAQASPGPATLAISREAMLRGRKAGVALALGVTTGSWTWSAIAAAGMSAMILAHEWLVIALRVTGALYLAWLAWKSARAALRPTGPTGPQPGLAKVGGSYARGLLIHLTNPKAILFFGALYAFGLPPGAPPFTPALIFAAVALQSLIVFVGLALVFSQARLASGYAAARRVFEALFAVVFGTAAISLMLSALRPLTTVVQKAP